jgi:hypothetical protein
MRTAKTRRRKKALGILRQEPVQGTVREVAMTKWLRMLLVVAGSAIVFPDTTADASKKEKVREEVAVIDTNMGRITLRFFSQESPKTVENFKSLIRSRFFDGTLFHKVLPGLLVQAGDPQSRWRLKRMI